MMYGKCLQPTKKADRINDQPFKLKYIANYRFTIINLSVA